MADSLVLYTSIHQPLPLRLPPQPAPTGVGPNGDGLERSLFDLDAAQQAFREIIGPAYLPAFDALRGLAERGIPLSVGLSEGFLGLCRRWSPELLRPLRQWLRTPAVEPVCIEPCCGLLYAFDMPGFMRSMADARDRLTQFTGAPPHSAEVSGFSLNHEVYDGLGRLGFAVIAAEGAAQARSGHHPGHPSRWGEGPLALHRLEWLSDELGYQLRGGRYDPARLADTAARIPGEVALVSFDFDALAFGPEAPGRGVALLADITAACAERGVGPLTMARAARRFERRALQTPPPVTTATAGLSIEDRVGDGWTERLIFGRMQQAHQAGRLLPHKGLREVGGWLLQRVNLAVPALAAGGGDLPPTYWRVFSWGERPGYDDTTSRVLAVYDQFIQVAVRHVREEVPA